MISAKVTLLSQVLGFQAIQEYFQLPPAKLPGAWSQYAVTLGRDATTEPKAALLFRILKWLCSHRFCRKFAACGYLLLRMCAFQGGVGSGSQFHWHESALNLQLFGRKRWFLFHPAMSSNNQQTTLEWLDSTYQQLPPQLKPVCITFEHENRNCNFSCL